MISLTTDDRFVTIHVGGRVRGDGGIGRRWGNGGTLGGRGDGDVLTHALLKILYSFHYAAAMLMSRAVNHSDVSLSPPALSLNSCNGGLLFH